METATPQLRRLRPQMQATSLGAEPILVGVETEEARTSTRNDNRSKCSPLAPLSK
jgi:hypothetical protein